MDKIRKLAELVRQLEDQLIVCMRCGMCQAVCPVFAETGRESDVARGKLALLDGLINQMFKDPSGVNERLNRCLLCGSCAANCPSGVKVIDIFIKARAILTGYVGLHPVKRAIFRGMLVRPKFFDGLLEFGAKFQHLFAKPVDELLGTSCGRMLSPLADRHFKTLAPTAFHKLAPTARTGRASGGIRAAFFVGCLVDKVYPNIGQALLRVLDHHGVTPVVPRDQGCCGIPALSSGDGATFDRLVEYNLGKFPDGDFDYLVTACATCTSTIRKLWPTFAIDLPPDQLARVRTIAGKTLDISEFLVDVLGVGGTASGSSDKILTYHDPCHLKKSLGIAAQPRALLRANSHYAFREMAEADKCCGCGGSFNLQYYDMSAAIGRRKRDSIIQSGCSTVATGCPACMLQITDMLSQAGDRIQVKHAIEIYADSLG